MHTNAQVYRFHSWFNGATDKSEIYNFYQFRSFRCCRRLILSSHFWIIASNSRLLFIATHQCDSVIRIVALAEFTLLIIMVTMSAENVKGNGEFNDERCNTTQIKLMMLFKRNLDFSFDNFFHSFLMAVFLMNAKKPETKTMKYFALVGQHSIECNLYDIRFKFQRIEWSEATIYTHTRTDRERERKMHDI